MDKTIELGAWEVLAENVFNAWGDVRKSSVAVVAAINAEESAAGKCAGRAAIEARWLKRGMDAGSKNKAWARLIAASHDAGLTMSPFTYPMPAEGARAKKARTAREKSAAIAELEAETKAKKTAIKAAEEAHSKALGGIRKMITDRARNCVLEVTLKRVLAAFDGPATKRKAPKAK
jgi:hypothetical protein